MDQLNLTDLPSELLQKIFSYFSTKELLIITEVSQLFNEIIGSNARLMGNVKVCWKDRNADILLASNRKYQKVCIHNKQSMSNLEGFLDRNARTITELKINTIRLRVSSFIRMMNKLKENLENLYVNNVKFKNDVEAIPATEMEVLDCLSISGCASFPVLADCFKDNDTIEIIQFLSHCEHSLSPTHTEQLPELLTRFKKFNTLTICNCLSQKVFANDNFAETAPDTIETFQAESIDEIHFNNLGKFLKNQSYLAWLEFKDLKVNAELLETILGIDGLTKLTLENVNFEVNRDIYVRNTSINTIIMTFEEDSIDQDSQFEVGVCKLLKNCKGAVKLYLRGLTITSDISSILSNSMSKLNLVSFDDCTLEPAVYPKVETMNFHEMRCQDVIELIQMNQQLKQIKLPRHIVINHPECEAMIQESKIETVEFWENHN